MAKFNDSGKVIGGMIVGGLIGGALGLLFAPYKGSRTRKLLANGAKDMAGEIKSKMKEKASELRDKAEELEDLAKEKVHKVVSSVNHK